MESIEQKLERLTHESYRAGYKRCIVDLKDKIRGYKEKTGNVDLANVVDLMVELYTDIQNIKPLDNDTQRKKVS